MQVSLVDLTFHSTYIRSQTHNPLYLSGLALARGMTNLNVNRSDVVIVWKNKCPSSPVPECWVGALSTHESLRAQFFLQVAAFVSMHVSRVGGQ